MVAPYLDKVLHKYSGGGGGARLARRALQLKLRKLRFPVRLAHGFRRRRDFGDARQRFAGQQTQPSHTKVLQLHGCRSILVKKMWRGWPYRASPVSSSKRTMRYLQAVERAKPKGGSGFQRQVLYFVSEEQRAASHGQAAPEVADELRDTPSLHLRVDSFGFGSCEANRLAHAQEPHDIRGEFHLLV